MYLVVYFYDLMPDLGDDSIRQADLPSYGPFPTLKAARAFLKELDNQGCATNMRVMKVV